MLQPSPLLSLNPMHSLCSAKSYKLEKDVFELKKIDHSAKALDTLRSQVSMVVEQYLRSKISDDLQKDKNVMDKGVTDTVKDHRRKHDDDEDPPARPNQGKAPSKDSKTGKSSSAKELVKKPSAEVVMDDVVNTMGKDVVHDDDQPQDTSKPKTNKTPNP
nr:hypothetical protein [Tanacetum cinerariifolium]